MIYLNNAATTYPKPECVKAAVEQVIVLPPSSQYRDFLGTEQTSVNSMQECREALAALFGIQQPERIVFSSGATQGMNQIVRGLCLDGAEILVSQTEHNAVLRTVCNIPRQPKIMVAPCDKQGYLSPSDFEALVTENTKAVFVNHCSNVTGAVADLRAISKMVHEKGALFIADVSQSAGVLPIDVEDMGIDILCFTAHKGLYGIEGSGGYYVRTGIPFVSSEFGGTGVNSRQIRMDKKTWPQAEPGTQNLPGIAGLLAGLRFIERTGRETIRKKEIMLLGYLQRGMKELQKQYPGCGLRVFCGGEAPVLSFTMETMKPQDIGYILAGSYGIITRTGLHCAPLIHRAMGTEKNGTVRISLSFFNTIEEMDYFLDALRGLAAASGTEV